MDLFIAIKEWIKHQDSLPEDTLKNILQLIRYPLICASDLIEKVNPTGLVDPSLYQAALDYRLSSKGYKGLKKEQTKLRAYYFNFRVLYGGKGMFIKQTPKGTMIIRKGVADTCHADLVHIDTLQFKLCIKQCSNSSSDDSIQLLLGYRGIHTAFAKVSVSDLLLNEEYDGIVSEKDGCFEIKVGGKEATVPIQRDRHIVTFAVYIRNVKDKIMITKT